MSFTSPFTSPFTAPLESTEQRPAAAASARKTTSRQLLWGTLGLLLAAPLAFGAVEPWAIFVLQAGSCLLFFIWLKDQGRDDAPAVAWNPLFAPMLAFFAFGLVQWALGLTAYRHATSQELMLLVCYGLLCFLLTQSLDRSSLSKVTGVLVVYGGALASFALLQGLAPNGRLYWLRTPSQGGWIYGPYVNHNHYAGLMELLVPIPILLAFSRHVTQVQRWILGGAGLVMATTIFLSGSRGGMVAFTVEALILGILVWRSAKKSPYRYYGLGGLVGFVLLVGLLGGQALLHRLTGVPGEAQGDLGIAMRMDINRDCVRMFLEKPIEGFGLGTFPVVNPQYRSFSTDNFVNAAHNDVLQLAVECGTIGVALAVWFLFLFYRQTLPALGGWKSSGTAALRTVCLVGVTGLLVHSLVDFNLHVPANAAIFYALCILGTHPGWGDDTLQKPGGGRRRHRSEPTPQAD